MCAHSKCLISNTDPVQYCPECGVNSILLYSDLPQCIIFPVCKGFYRFTLWGLLSGNAQKVKQLNLLSMNVIVEEYQDLLYYWLQGKTNCFNSESQQNGLFHRIMWPGLTSCNYPPPPSSAPHPCPPHIRPSHTLRCCTSMRCPVMHFPTCW